MMLDDTRFLIDAAISGSYFYSWVTAAGLFDIERASAPPT